MKKFTVGENKIKFSDASKYEDRFTISYGKKKNINPLIISTNNKNKKRKTGILDGKANIEFIGGHNTSEDEFFGI